MVVNEEEIHRKCNCEDPEKIISALQQLESEFEHLSNKEQAYEDISKLALENSKESLVFIDVDYYLSKKFFHPNFFETRYEKNTRVKAIKVLGAIFRHITDKKQAWNDLHTLTLDDDYYVRGNAAKAFGIAIPHMLDKNQAWEDLHRLTADEDRYVRYKAVKALRNNFQHAPNKLKAWEDLHRLTLDKDGYVRSKAAKALQIIFVDLPDKKRVGENLHRLTSDKFYEVQAVTALVLGNLFQDLPDKNLAGEDLHKLASCRHFNRYINSRVRSSVAEALGIAFKYIPDKTQAWKDLHDLTLSKDDSIQRVAAETLGVTFQYAPDKDQAWEDLCRLTLHKDWQVKSSAVRALGIAFQYIPDKNKAWSELHRLILSGVSERYNMVSCSSAKALGVAFQYIPNKEQAWDDLHALILNEDYNISNRAAEALGLAFPYIPDKIHAWKYLVKLVKNKSSHVYLEKYLESAFQYMPDKDEAWKDLVELSYEDVCIQFGSVKALGTPAFQYLSDKNKAWDDLLKLTSHTQMGVAYRAAKGLGSVFLYTSNKNKAWVDLHTLVSDKNPSVRKGTAEALGIAFQYLPDKSRAFEDLHKLILDNDANTRAGAAEAMLAAFQYIPDKIKVCEDLYLLLTDKSRYVRGMTCHFLGKICIYKASQSQNEEEFIKELENSIFFFAKSVEEFDPSPVWPPSIFCLQLYFSFYMIIQSESQQPKDKIYKCIKDTKKWIGNSREKELLYKTVENLAHASETIYKLENIDTETMKNELKYFNECLEQAEKLMEETEKTTFLATKIMRKGPPILNRKLKSLLKEIQEKAKTACRESQGTPTQEIARTVCQEVQKWEISDPTDMEEYIKDISFSLKGKVQNHPENEYLLYKIEVMRIETDLTKKFQLLSYIIGEIPTVKVVQDEAVKRGIDEIRQDIASVDIKIDKKATAILNKLDKIQEELNQGFEKLDKLSTEVGGIEGESIKIFSEKFLETTKKGDSKAIERFLEELLKDEGKLINEIDSSSAPQNKKEDSKRSIFKLKLLLEKIKNPMKAFGKDVTKELIVNYAAKGIIELIIPIMFLAVFGVPMPSHITEILAIVTK